MFPLDNIPFLLQIDHGCHWHQKMKATLFRCGWQQKFFRILNPPSSIATQLYRNSFCLSSTDILGKQGCQRQSSPSTPLQICRRYRHSLAERQWAAAHGERVTKIGESHRTEDQLEENDAFSLRFSTLKTRGENTKSKNASNLSKHSQLKNGCIRKLFRRCVNKLPNWLTL